jgi:hypothetical protein
MRISILVAATLIIVSCQKSGTLPEPSALNSGTYRGEKVVYYLSSGHSAIDTITIRFDDPGYHYSGTSELDYGKGNYFVAGDSVWFSDEYARIAIYTWDWILSGRYRFVTAGDSLTFTKKYYDQLTICRLARLSGQ